MFYRPQFHLEPYQEALLYSYCNHVRYFQSKSHPGGNEEVTIPIQHIHIKADLHNKTKGKNCMKTFVIYCSSLPLEKNIKYAKNNFQIVSVAVIV